MTETTIERVAKAICDGNWNAKDFTETANGETPDEQRDYWRGIARAAIEAMREPTEVMIEAGEREAGHSLYRWAAMIDEALK